MALTEIDLTEGRNALNRTGHEISQAAKYCSSNYLKANGQRRVIDETMNYATQSLGTMIHHINNLATTFLTLLDEKTEKMSNVEESVNQLSMVGSKLVVYLNKLLGDKNSAGKGRPQGDWFVHHIKGTCQVYIDESSPRSPGGVREATY